MKYKSHALFIVLAISLLSGQTAGVAAESTPAAPAVEVQQTEPKLDWRGLAYGPFRGVGPDRTEIVSRANLEEDMKILQDLGTNHIRTYGIGLGLNQIPFIAAQYNITTATGTWIHSGNPNNTQEIITALAAEDVSSMVIVGNEVLTGKVGIPESQLVELVNVAKENREDPNFPIATAEEWIYFYNENVTSGEFYTTPIGEAVDTIIIHAHPAWHKVPLAEAAQWTIDKYFDIKNLYPNKTVILGETGWPSESVPANPLFTPENQKAFFDDLLPLIDQHDIKSYLFAAFDENWKNEVYEGEYQIGPYWGLIEERRYGKLVTNTIMDYFGGTISTDPPIPIDPQVNSPEDFQVDVGAEASISWTITDEDTAKGTYTIYRNNFIQGTANNTWTSGVPIPWNVDTSQEGVYKFKITFADGRDVLFEDVVVVTVGNPTSESDGLSGFGMIYSAVAFAFIAIWMRRSPKTKQV